MFHPSEWKSCGDSPSSTLEEEKQQWKVELHNKLLESIRNNNIKQPKEIKGVYQSTFGTLLGKKHYIFPQLRFEIGVISMVLNNFYSFIEEPIEVLSTVEKAACNSVATEETSLEVSKKELEE